MLFSLDLDGFISWDMGRKNINFNLLSLNARGLRTFDRRKAFFNWLARSSADICFLQETYSTSEVENIWKKQWKGDMGIIFCKSQTFLNTNFVKLSKIWEYILALT